MSKNILFRGQTRKKGEKVTMSGTPIPSNWVFGGIFPQNNGGDFAIIYQQDPEIQKFPVYAETVCQYTGKNDKYGGKIFENDIITVTTDICRDNFSDAVAAFKTYVRYITHDMIELSIPDLVEKRVEGILSISYECEQEGYFETDTNAVCVDSERIHYSRETHHDTIFESKRIATNIKWDTDGEEVDLPNQMVIPDNVHDDVNAIGDYLSDETGFCHFGFGLVYEATVKVNRKDTKVINDLLSGKDLDWDADETHSINIQFRNGTNVDIMLCCPPESHANEPEGTPWTQARWYDSDEKEISCYCNDDTFFDDWAMTVENDPALSGPVSYMVHVIEE